MNAELRTGDFVEVRSADEILATLAPDGTLAGMPFMPEMLQFAGRTFQVRTRADKTCDTTNRTGLRRLRDTVHLANLRCDGSAHDGCQAGCLLYWNEGWLRRPGVPAPASAPASTSAGRVTVSTADLDRLTRLGGDSGSPRYTCQATEMVAASTPLPWWGPAQYVRDVRTGNASVGQVVLGIWRWLSVRIQWRINGSGVPGVKGRLRKTPKRLLDLQPGDLVRVKSRREIEATLDTGNRNRGLRVDPDQLLFCGQESRVLGRVNRIIDERTREMLEFEGDCIVLEGTTCTGSYNRSCPRADNPYWREIWLERVTTRPTRPSDPAAAR